MASARQQPLLRGLPRDRRGAGLFMRLVEATGGTFRPEPHDILANDEHGVALIILTAERNGKTITDNETHVVHFRDGKVAESWIQLGAAYLELDPFFS